MLTQTTLPFGYVDPPTEIFVDNVTPGPVTSTYLPIAPPLGYSITQTNAQFWKITHNAWIPTVSTSTCSTSSFSTGWVGMGTVKPPLPQELGWKETVVMNPLEDIVVAFQAVAPRLPFGIPNSVPPL